MDTQEPPASHVDGGPSTIYLLRSGNVDTDAEHLRARAAARLRSAVGPSSDVFVADPALPGPAPAHDLIVRHPGPGADAPDGAIVDLASDTGHEVQILRVRTHVVLEAAQAEEPPDEWIHSFVVLGRRAGLSLTAFSERWLDHHAPLVLTTPDVVDNLHRYAQHHPAGDADAGGPDGVAETIFPSVAAMKRIFRSPSRTAVAEDELTFLDAAASAITLCRAVQPGAGADRQDRSSM